MKRIFIVTLIVTALAASLAAQPVEERVALPGHPCPHPVRILIKGETHPPRPSPAAARRLASP